MRMGISDGSKIQCNLHQTSDFRLNNSRLEQLSDAEQKLMILHFYATINFHATINLVREERR